MLPSPRYGDARNSLLVLATLFVALWMVWTYLESNGGDKVTTIHGRRLSRSTKPSDPDRRHLDAFVLRNGGSNNSSDIAPLNATKMERQARIANHIQNLCSGSRTMTLWEKNYLLRHLIVDDKYRLIYCYVPKVGCANWKRVFNALYGDVSSPDDVRRVDHTSMVYLSTYSEAEIQYRLKHYFKFMFVRHPVDRLLSAYRNKFGEHFKDFEQKYGTKIVKQFRPNPPSNPKGDDITFAEFLLYVASSKKSELNEHWSAYVDLCQPCSVSYDFVGFYEDFEDDIAFILDALMLNKILQFPKKQAYYKPLSDESKMEYIRRVPNSTLDNLVEALSTDFELFGYPTDDWLGRSRL